MTIKPGEEGACVCRFLSLPYIWCYLIYESKEEDGIFFFFFKLLKITKAMLLRVTVLDTWAN